MWYIYIYISLIFCYPSYDHFVLSLSFISDFSGRISEEAAAMWKKHVERDDSRIVGKESNLVVFQSYLQHEVHVGNNLSPAFPFTSLTDLFSGQLRSSLHCSVCSHHSNTFDVFCDLSLPIPKRSSAGEVTLRECLDLFSQEEKLDKENSPVS